MNNKKLSLGTLIRDVNSLGLEQVAKRFELAPDQLKAKNIIVRRL